MGGFSSSEWVATPELKSLHAALHSLPVSWLDSLIYFTCYAFNGALSSKLSLNVSAGWLRVHDELRRARRARVVRPRAKLEEEKDKSSHATRRSSVYPAAWTRVAFSELV